MKYRITTFPLYALFFTFILSCILSITRDDNMLYYLFSLIGIFFVLFEIGLTKSKAFFRFNTLDAIFLCVFSILISLSLLLRFEPMGFVLLLTIGASTWRLFGIGCKLFGNEGCL